jgi:hypothetical protein
VLGEAVGLYVARVREELVESLGRLVEDDLVVVLGHDRLLRVLRLPFAWVQP